MKPYIQIWYADHTVTIEDFNKFNELPNENVVAILEFFGVDDFGRRLFRVSSGSDWYWLEDDGIHHSGTSSDDPGVWFENPVPKNTTVKSGVWVSDDVMINIENQIKSIVHG